MSVDGAGYVPPELISRLRALAGNGPASGPAGERCDLCGAELPEDHRHLLHLEERSIRCACEPCVAMRSGEGPYRTTGIRFLWLEGFDLSEELWASLRIPIGLAFFMRSSSVDRVVGRYPSPAGATECELELLDRRLEPIDAHLLEVARADDRVRLLRTIPGVGWLLGLTFAVEIGDVSRFPSAAKLVGYSGLVPRVSQSGQSSRTGRLSRAGSPLLRWAAVEAAQHAWREQNPWHRLYVDVRARHGNGNAAKSAVARKVLIAVWHVWSRQEPFKPAAARAAAPTVPASSGQPLAA